MLINLVLYLIFSFVPHSFFDAYFTLPDRYWFVAIPTHFFVTLVYLFFMIRAYSYYLNDDDPIKEGKLYKNYF